MGRYVTRGLKGRKNVSDYERLQAYLSTVTIDSETGCWFSPGYVTKSGYRRVRHNRRMVNLHRFVFEQLCESVPDGKQLHHTCRNKQCLYPRHLEILSAAEHTRKHPEIREKIIAQRLARTHCARGHAFTPENTYTTPGTRKRNCRICQREAGRRYDAKRIR